MGYQYRFQKDQALLVIVFKGEIPYQEEVDAVLACVHDPGMEQDISILVDKREAQMTVGPEHVEKHIELIRKHLSSFGQPRVATVLASDYDFGMTRMLQIASEPVLPHEFKVFRSLGAACTWLGVNPRAIDWPE